MSQCGVFNVRDFGALGDSIALDHHAIQRAIDAAAASGGGTVLLPPGNYRCGSIKLKSSVHLHLEFGAKIIGSSNREDYTIFEKGMTYNDNAPQLIDLRYFLIVGDTIDNAAITGMGTIDGNGAAFYEEQEINGKPLYAPKSWRPCGVLLFFNCTDVRLDGVSIKNSPCFAVHLYGCANIQAHALRIAADMRFHNSDGIHVVSSRNMTISDCIINSEDDALAFFTNWAGFPELGDFCTNITVTNCVLSAKCSGIRIGYAGSGEISNMIFSNLIISNTNRGIDFICNRFNAHHHAQQSPGTKIHNLLFSNIIINNSNWGITANVDSAHPLEEVKTWYPKTPRTNAIDSPVWPVGISKLFFSDMLVNSNRGNYLLGCKTSPITGLEFKNVRFYIHGNLKKAVNPVPESVCIFAGANIPYGLFIRNTRNIRFHNSSIDMANASGEWLQAFMAESATDLNTTPEII
jgi:polygalacturonase